VSSYVIVFVAFSFGAIFLVFVVLFLFGIFFVTLVICLFYLCFLFVLGIIPKGVLVQRLMHGNSRKNVYSA